VSQQESFAIWWAATATVLSKSNASEIRNFDFCLKFANFHQKIAQNSEGKFVAFRAINIHFIHLNNRPKFHWFSTTQQKFATNNILSSISA